MTTSGRTEPRLAGAGLAGAGLAAALAGAALAGTALPGGTPPLPAPLPARGGVAVLAGGAGCLTPVRGCGAGRAAACWAQSGAGPLAEAAVLGAGGAGGGVAGA